MNFLADVLYVVTSGLLIPCVAILLVLLASSFVQVGRYWVACRRQGPAVERLVAELKRWDGSGEDVLETAGLPDQLASGVQGIQQARSEALAAFLLSEFETTADQELSRLTRFARLGPILGLMGTLIPMGPALQGLANGDLAQLSNQMQVAFTTTVVGLLVGAVGFVLYQQRRRVASRELSILEYLAALRFGDDADE